MAEENKLIIDGRTRRQRVEVFALGENGTMLAFSHGVNSYMELPGGGVNEGETILQAGMRELAEESGWTATEPKILSVPGDCVFVEDENSWLKQNGYDEEESLAIVCHVNDFKPGQKFGSEGDALNYDLMSFNRVIEETRNTLNNTTDKRGKYIAAYRLKAMDQLYKLSLRLDTQSKIYWKNW
jgi:8-oxo-dGTP pyrophosphatase MutT (NUDIX family)